MSRHAAHALHWPFRLTLAASVATLACAFLPWGISGEARRSSFQLLGVAQRLGIFDGPVRSAVAVGWYLVPLLVALMWVGVVTGYRWPVTGLAVVVGALGVVLAIAVWRSPVQAGIGANATMLTGVVGVLSAGLTVWRDKEQS